MIGVLGLNGTTAVVDVGSGGGAALGAGAGAGRFLLQLNDFCPVDPQASVVHPSR